MKKNIVILFVSLLSIFGFSQNNYFPGEIIKSDSTKVRGLIKYVELRKTPQSFLFKENENSNVVELKFEDILSVDVLDKVKYVKKTFKLSKHSNNIGFLDNKKDFVLQEETKFIEELVDGKFKLYYLSDTDVNHFFYSKDSLNTVLPLLNKQYNDFESKVIENEEYKKELYLNVFCDNNILLKNEVNKLKYKEAELIEYFIKTNECITGIKQKKKEKNYGYSKFKIILETNLINTSSNVVEISKTNKTIFGIGAEFEHFLPYYKYMFSFVASPSYVKYKSDVVFSNIDYIGGGPVYFTNGQISAEAFSIPINLRVYPINKKVFKVYASLPLFNLYGYWKSNVFENGNKYLGGFTMPASGFVELGFKYKKFELSYKKFENRNSNTSIHRSVVCFKYDMF